MKYLSNITMIMLSSLLIVSSILLLKEKKSVKKINHVNNELIDSVNKYKASSYYLKNIWNQLRDNHDLKIEKGSNVYKLENSKKNKIDISKIAKENKLFVIRYTEIGCNACLDSTFKLLKRYKNLKKYKIITMVDFNNDDYYLKWRKISEFEGDVYWVKKGDILYPVENGANSYIFTLNNDLKSESLFIPNSLHVDLLKEYLQSL